MLLFEFSPAYFFDRTDQMNNWNQPFRAIFKKNYFDFEFENSKRYKTGFHLIMDEII